MKFYDLDLTQIIPFGIPLNTENHVEYTGYLNEFFLRGFENWFKTLFTLEGGELTRDYSRSCSAPFSLPACEFCNDSQLQTFIEENGFKYYSNNAHNINAQFLYDLYKYPFGTEDYLTSIARYCANTLEVEASAVYGDTPYLYTINISGDISGSVNVGELSERMIEHLKILGTAHTKVDGFRFEEDDNTAEVYCGGAVDDIQTMLSLSVSEPVDDTTIKNILKNSLYYRNVTLNNSSLRGCPRSQYSYLTTNYTTFEDTIIRFHISGINSIPYPMIGYQDYRRMTSTSRYVVNDQDLPRQLLSSDRMTRSLYFTQFRIQEFGFSDFRKEVLYDNLGIRKQVFSFRQAGFKHYIDADDYVTSPNSFVIMKEGSLQNYAPRGYFHDQHFMGYLSNDGKAIASFGGAGNVYKVGYKIGSSDINKFLKDDAFDYVVDRVHGCDDLTHIPTLGSVTDVEIYDQISDINGDPIDYDNSFTFGFDSNHRLTIECSQVIDNAVWVQFHLVPKSGYLEGWATVTADAGSSNSSGTTTFGFYKSYSSSLQPGGVVEGDNESDFGQGFEPVCCYAASNPTPNARFFRHITEMMAFAGYANLTTFFSYQTNNNNLQHEVRNHVQRIWGPLLNSSCLYVVARFTSINHHDITMDWQNPRKNRSYSLEITSELAFGISQGYDGCKIYIVDEVNHDTSLSSSIRTELEYKNNGKYNLIFKYISDDIIDTITHIKVHADFHLK